MSCPRIAVVGPVSSSVLASQEAVRLARDYIRGRRSKILPSVAARTVALSLSSGDSVDELLLRLQAAELVVTEIEDCLAPGASEEAAWVRHDPERALNEGFNSPSYVCIDQEGLINAASIYLQQEWLASPVIDWMIVDALITTTMIEYGEASKRNILSQHDETSDVIFNPAYRDAGGNLSKLLENAPAAKRRVMLFVLFGVAPPAIFAPFAFTNFYALAHIGSILYPLCIVPYMLYRFQVSRRRRLEVLKDFEEALQKWRLMYDVWKLLEGPVLDSQRIAEELVRAARAGVEFDPVVYRIVERAVAARRSWSITSSAIKLRF